MRAETIIATHSSTDFDALASMLAARRLYPGSAAVLQPMLARNVREFARLYADELELVEAAAIDQTQVRRLVVVETVDASRLGELEPLALDPAVEKIVFDHHERDQPEWVKEENLYLAESGALTTTLVGIVAERELAVSPLEATVFALGIHEDTGSLTFASTTQRDAEAVAWCLRHGARLDELGHFLRPTLGDEERELLAELLASIQPLQAAGVELLIASSSWPRYLEDVALLAHKLVDLTDCDALACLVEMEGRVLGVFRSRVPELDAAKLAASLGGGGHRGAASASARISLEQARVKVEAGLGAALEQLRRASEVMSSPARFVEPETTVAEAMAACQRYRQSGILVLEDGHLRGAVNREDLDKALGHGLDQAPVKAIMALEVAVCDQATTLPELRRMLVDSAAGRIAVVEDGGVVGVVTRGDLLAAFGLQEAPEKTAEFGLELELERLKSLTPLREAIAAIGGAYEGIYLVGGSVRDVLLGAEVFDIDIAVEGDAIGLARELARLLQGRVRAHEKFGTAVVIYGDEARVDVVTTRTEFYDAPAALPSVEHATIREDLFRRDFTVNAMAVSLKADDFGRLVDPFGGRRDIVDRRLRVLHNLSFVDDPTRIFRAVRYESRLGFHMDEHAVALAHSCVEMGLFDDLSSARLRDELIEILDEPDAPRSILRLAEIGVAAAVHPRLAADEEAVALVERVYPLRDRYAPEVPHWRLGLAVLARRLPTYEVYSWLGRLRLRRRDVERIVASVAYAPRLVERLQREASPAEIVSLVKPVGPDAALIALALQELPALEQYFERLRGIELEVNGGDLMELGLAQSPRVGEILGELRRRKLNGELAGRETELEAARGLIAESN
ncbi:MAG: CBS domain-containing protein [Gaiellaceae bacterium]|jgi:tRNA nucleotidyltransferase (CCA-adding enzyme)